MKLHEVGMFITLHACELASAIAKSQIHRYSSTTRLYGLTASPYSLTAFTLKLKVCQTPYIVTSTQSFQLACYHLLPIRAALM